MLYGEPMHPYTQALLCAVPIPDPEAEEHRRAVVLHGRRALARSTRRRAATSTLAARAMQQGLCDVETPALKEVRPGHLAACHLITTSDFPHIRAGEDDLAVVAAGPVQGDTAVPAESTTDDESTGG